MKKHLVGLSVLLSLLILAAPATAVSWSELLEFEAPFAFVVNDTTLPAGSYVVETPDLQDPTKMRVVDADTRDEMKAVYFATQPVNQSWDVQELDQREPKVVFAEHDGDQILLEVWIPSHTNGREVVSDLDLQKSERTEVRSGDR